MFLWLGMPSAYFLVDKYVFIIYFFIFIVYNFSIGGGKYG
jgi:hypothetical protein